MNDRLLDQKRLQGNREYDHRQALQACDALHMGRAVKLPEGANAITVTTERGHIANVLVADVSSLLHAGPYKTATAGHVKFFRTGGPNWKTFEVVRGRIEVVRAE